MHTHMVCMPMLAGVPYNVATLLRIRRENPRYAAGRGEPVY